MPRSLAPALFSAAILLTTAAFGASIATYPGHPKTSPGITAADLSARNKAIADDAFEGRGPGSVAGEASAQWIADELKRIGVGPANRGSYFQKVPAVAITLDTKASHFAITTPKGLLTPQPGDHVNYWTPRFAKPDIAVADSELVFVGYGVVAPEYGWNDYAGMNVKGKTVVVLVNDPGNQDARPDPGLFKGKAMTYYGRWTYKFEEAARQGAAAAIIVHETKPAAYGWQVVGNSYGTAKMWQEAKNGNSSMLPIQSWITLDTAKDLFRRAGLNYLALKAAANKRGFKAVPMTGERLNVTAHSLISHTASRNVVGMIPGAKQPDDIVIFSAHWDHLGRKDSLPGKDKIYNGAVDDGLGTSQVLELAEKFSHDKPPQRSLVFAFWTLEEEGLLGSEYFGVNPLWPRNHIVGVINLDDGGPQPRARDVKALGSGQSELEDVLKQALATQHRLLSPDPEPEKGLFFRADHFSLAKLGIPAISPGGGHDLLAGGNAAGQKLADDYTDHRYHQPSDEWRADWDLSGPMEDMQAYYLAGVALANSDKWPNYYKSSEFRALRDKDMAQKK